MFAHFGAKSGRLAGLVVIAGLVAVPLSSCSAQMKSTPTSPSSTYQPSGFDYSWLQILTIGQDEYDKGLMPSNLPVRQYAVTFFCKKVNTDAGYYTAIYDAAAYGYDGVKPPVYDDAYLQKLHPAYKSAKFDAVVKQRCPSKLLG